MRTLGRKRRRDLVLRKWQYGAAGLTVFLGTLAFAASYDAYRNLDASYRHTYERLALADVTVTGADATFAETVRHFESVVATEDRIQADVPLRLQGGHTFVGRLVGLPPDGPRLDGIDVVKGKALAPGVANGALAETHMYEHFKLAPGDQAEYFDGVRWRSLEVVGSALSPEYLWPIPSAQDALATPDEFGVLFVPEATVATLPPTAIESQVLVGYRANANVAKVDAAVERAAQWAGATSVIVKAEQPSNKALHLDVLGFEQMAYAFPALFLLAAGMATYTLLTRLVLQERQLIGTLRANGLGRAAVVRHYLSYGAWLGGVAGVLGVVVGAPLGWLMTAAYTGSLGIPDTSRSLHWATIVVGIGFGLGCGLVSAWLPARYAAGLDPAEAMRGEMATVAGHRNILERLLPLLRRLPARQRLVLRGIARNRRRSGSTILGVVLALVLLLAAWGMMDTTRYLVDAQFVDIEHEDASITFSGPVDDAAVERVAATDGVAAAERVYVLAVSIRHGGDTYATQLFVFNADTQMHDFSVPLPDDGVVLGAQLRKRLALAEGDQVGLAFTSLNTETDAPVGGFVVEPLGTFAYMRPAALDAALARGRLPITEQDLAWPETAVVLARFADGVDRDEVLQSLKQVDGVAAVRDSREIQLLVEKYLGLFYIFIGIMFAFGGLLALALMFTTLSANLAERAAELAMMRANGFSRRQIAGLVVWENLLLTLIGIPLGLVAGYLAARALMASYSTDMFVFDLHMASFTYVWCALAMVLVTLASLWPSLRAVERMDIGAIVRQRST